MNEIIRPKYSNLRYSALFSIIVTLCYSGQIPSAMAETTSDVDTDNTSNKSPFFSQPLDLIDEFSTKPEYDTGKPSVMLLIEDSANMNTEVDLDVSRLTKENVCKNAYTYLFSNNEKYYKKLVNLTRDFRIRFHDEEIVPPEGCRMIEVLTTVSEAGENSNTNLGGGDIGSDQVTRVMAYLPDNEEDNYIKKLRKFPSRNTSRGYSTLDDYRRDNSRLIYYDKDHNNRLTMAQQRAYAGLTSVNDTVMKANLWFKDIPSAGRRSDIVKSSLKKVLSKYGDKIDWNLLSLWGSENWEKTECAYEWNNPAVYPYGGADAILGKLPTLFGPSYRKFPEFSNKVNNFLNRPGRYSYDPVWFYYAQKDYQHCDGLSAYVPKVSKISSPYQRLNDDVRQAPLVWRYIQAGQQASNYVVEQNKKLDDAAKQCRNDFIVIFADALPLNHFNSYENGLSDAIISDFNFVNTEQGQVNLYGKFSGIKTDHINGITIDQGISFFSDKLFHTDKLGGSRIQTFTIGFGEKKGGRQFLVNSAKALKPGETELPKPTGTGENMNKYGFWNAKNEVELNAAFEEIFQNILTQTDLNTIDTGSIASPGNTSSTETGIAATLTLYTGNWSSLLKFHEFDDGGQPKIGSSKNAKYEGRLVLMNNGESSYWLNNGDLPENANQDFGFTNKKEFTKAFVPWLVRAPTKSDASIEESVAAMADKKVSIYRNRLADLPSSINGSEVNLYREMGDVLAAPVIGIDANVEGNGRRYVITGANDGMVYIFQNADSTDRPYELKLNYIPGSIPRENAEDTLAKNLYKLAENNYGQRENPHIYGVNGGINYVKTSKTAKMGANDQKVERPQEIIALGAMGQGGRGIYALKIAGCNRNSTGCSPVGLDADSSKWQTSVPLWESKAMSNDTAVSEKDQIKLGYTVGKPLMYQLATKWSGSGTAATANVADGVRVAGFVGNGFRPSNADLAYEAYPTLYIYDVLGEEIGTNQEAGKSSAVSTAGKLLGKISVKESDIDSNVKLLNGSSGIGALSSPAIVDVNRDGIADIAYAGDYAGNLYRFDLRGAPDDWRAVKIYQGHIELLSNNDRLATQPITAAPSVYRENDKELIVLFGTGSDLFERDVIPKNCEAIKETIVRRSCEEHQYWDKRQGFFGIKDNISNTNSVQPVSRNQLVKQSFIEKEVEIDKGSEKEKQVQRHFDRVASVSASERGWWFELNAGQSAASLPKNSKIERTISAEKSVTKPVVLLDTVFFSTRIYHYDEINKEPTLSSTQQCPIYKSGKKSGGESWLMGVNVFTGGTPTGVTFESDSSSTSTVGIKLNNLASGAVLNRTGNRQIENALKNNSEVDDGVLGDLTVPPTEPKNCLTADDYFLMLSQANKDNPLYSKKITGPICPNPGMLIRLNMREIIE